MSLQAEAEENLRVIRSLMERATAYRAISVPTALVAGGLSVAAGALVVAWPSAQEAATFRNLWWGVLALVAAANAFFLARERAAAGRATPFFNPGLNAALRAMAPSLFAGLIIPLMMNGDPMACAVAWAFFYGLALLSMSHFAPRSITFLGLAFFLTGLLVLANLGFVKDWLTGLSVGYFGLPPSRHGWSELARVPGIIMAFTFGLYHLIYAAAVAFSARRADPPADV